MGAILKRDAGEGETPTSEGTQCEAPSGGEVQREPSEGRVLGHPGRSETGGGRAGDGAPGRRRRQGPEGL